MGHIAFVCPGQGSQSVGMGRAIAEGSPAAAAVFVAADRALGVPTDVTDPASLQKVRDYKSAKKAAAKAV